jgi:hypothetical protein
MERLPMATCPVLISTPESLMQYAMHIVIVVKIIVCILN